MDSNYKYRVNEHNQLEKVNKDSDTDNNLKRSYEKEVLLKELVESGKKFDKGKPNLDLVLGSFANALYHVGEVGTYGAKKYSPDNWLKVNQERYASAMLRHYFEFKKGDNFFDEESGLSHLAHMAWNALAVLELEIRKHSPSLPISSSK